MVVVPVNAEKNKAEHVAQKDRNKRTQDFQVRSLGDFQLQHHDGDDDGNHAVAEGFQPSLAHGFPHFAYFFLEVLAASARSSRARRTGLIRPRKRTWPLTSTTGTQSPYCETNSASPGTSTARRVKPCRSLAASNCFQASSHK